VSDISDFLQDYTINAGITAILMTIKNPKSAARLLPAFLKLAGALTVLIEGLGQRAALDASIEKARAANPMQSSPPVST
jgi:hypothetical protein